MGKGLHGSGGSGQDWGQDFHRFAQNFHRPGKSLHGFEKGLHGFQNSRQSFWRTDPDSRLIFRQGQDSVSGRWTAWSLGGGAGVGA